MGKLAKSRLPNRSGGHFLVEREKPIFQRYATNAATNETATSTGLSADTSTRLNASVATNETAVSPKRSTAVSTQFGTGDFQRYATNAATNETDTITGDAVATNGLEPPSIVPRKRIAPVQTNKRIEIKAHELADGGKGLYWRWRWQENGRRRSSYGGTIGSLANKERISQYRRNSARYWRRIKENGT